MAEVYNYCTHRRISLRSDWMRTLQCRNNSQILEDNCQGSWESPRTLLVLPGGCNNQYSDECLKFEILTYKCEGLLFCRYVRYHIDTNRSKILQQEGVCLHHITASIFAKLSFRYQHHQLAVYYQGGTETTGTLFSFGSSSFIWRYVFENCAALFLSFFCVCVKMEEK